MFFQRKSEKYMKRTLLIFLLGLMFPSASLAVEAGASACLKQPLTTTFVDTRIDKLEHYLASHNSPLASYAATFIAKADRYHLPDWRLVPAIAGVESTFGKAIPANSYNAYGWANGAFAFTSWEESIDIVTRTLKYKYYDRGVDTIEKIERIYAPPSSTWARNVRFFMKKIAEFEPKDERIALSL
jgi:hypothetical protein